MQWARSRAAAAAGAHVAADEERPVSVARTGNAASSARPTSYETDELEVGGPGCIASSWRSGCAVRRSRCQDKRGSRLNRRQACSA